MKFAGSRLVAVIAASLIGAVQAQSAFDAASAPGVQAPKPTFEYARLRSKVQSNDVIGHYRTGFFCGQDSESHAVSTIDAIANSNGQFAFKSVTRELHVPLFEGDLSPFDTGTPKSADYRVGGVMQRLYLDTCSDGHSRKGRGEVDVKWEVYSAKLQRVVLSRTVTGDFASEDWVTSGASIEARAFQKSLRLFMTSDEFRELEDGKLPEGALAVTLQPLHLKTGTAVEGNATARADALTKAVVTVISDIGSGTGFYIADGYLLTDRHVVGSQRYVKIKLSNGKQLVGEVLRQDAARDVALLQTESTGAPVLRVSLVDPPVGSPMVAIGSPLGEALAGTFTQGVLSGIREFNGSRFYQSDVAINHGNSGGPMLDANSRVVGLADVHIEQSSGLSFFVPIKDALDRLAVLIDDAPPAH